MMARLQIRKSWALLGLLTVWIVIARFTQGVSTLELPTAENTAVTGALRDAAASIRGNRTSSPAFVYFFNPIRVFINEFVDLIRAAISVPASGAVIPWIGWFGVVGIMAFLAYATSRLRVALLVATLLFGCGALGMWQYTMDSLALTLAAVVLSLAIGIPIGVWAGLSDRVLKVVTPFLDLAQILPTLVYLAPLALFFLIGEASATIATMVYSIPISIRITSHAIRNLKVAPVEASESMGATRWQTLTKVQLPMAKQLIVLGVNQTVMAALSFAVIAALIAAPGLGKPVIAALIIRNVGEGFVAGLAVVFVAIMLDRSTSAAAKQQHGFVPPTPKERAQRRIKVAIAGAAAIASVIMSQSMMWAAVWPASIDVSKQVADATNALVNWATTDLYFATVGFKDFISNTVLNPLEGLLAHAPWFLTFGAICGIALILGGIRVAALAAALMAGMVATGLWFEAMITLTQTIVATLLTMLLGVILGVWIGRSERADAFLRPFLDAGQTMPAFVYLIPMLGLFGPTRFTAIATGIVYSIPVVVKIVGEGVRSVPETIMEAATAAGSSTRQLITKVQLPESRKSLLLATNQGMIFVLAVVVIGGFVGSGGLGYLVILGQSKPELQGKGLTAGLVILLLGVMIDRITQAAARRT